MYLANYNFKKKRENEKFHIAECCCCFCCYFDREIKIEVEINKIER